MLNLDAWRKPVVVAVPDDELEFILVPAEVEAAAILDMCCQVNAYQADCKQDSIIRSALMVTMGGLRPGVMIYDHLVKGQSAQMPPIEFGTIGVSFYRDLAVRHQQPVVTEPASISVEGRTVLVIDDLGDTGATLKFVEESLLGQGAHKILNMVLYVKPEAKSACHIDFSFGETSQSTWIITPREQVETLVQRVPVWKTRGASESECRRRLIELIGYPSYIVDQYLPMAYNADSD